MRVNFLFLALIFSSQLSWAMAPRPLHLKVLSHNLEKLTLVKFSQNNSSEYYYDCYAHIDYQFYFEKIVETFANGDQQNLPLSTQYLAPQIITSQSFRLHLPVEYPKTSSQFIVKKSFFKINEVTKNNLISKIDERGRQSEELAIKSIDCISLNQALGKVQADLDREKQKSLQLKFDINQEELKWYEEMLGR